MTMNELICRLAEEDPTRFSEELKIVSHDHKVHADTTRDAVASRIALKMAVDAQTMADDLAHNRLNVEKLTFSQMIIAFGVAAKVLNLTREQIGYCTTVADALATRAT